MKNILDPSFKYTNAASTDISKTFERVRAEMRKSTQAKNLEKPLVSDNQIMFKTLSDFDEILGSRSDSR